MTRTCWSTGWIGAISLNKRKHVNFFGSLRPIAIPALGVVDRAIDLTGRYSLSHWDSMLLGACLEAGVDILYTEDMGAPVTYDNIRLINPFS